MKPHSFAQDIKNINQIKFDNGVIGYHWFGEDPLTTVYEKSRDLLIKPSGYSFDGFLPKLVDLYQKETEQIYQKYKPKEIKKISIVMSYHNRKSQLLTTLKTIKKSKHPNYEIIIVDDGSDEDHRIENLQNEYGFKLMKPSTD